LGVPRIVMFPRAVRDLAHNKECGLLS